jgi:ribosomal peptide maturation radical SAM protein 1
MKILLVQAPWGASYKPSIGLHILQSYLKSRHHSWNIEIKYTNLDFHDYLPGSFNRELLIQHFWDNPCLFWISEGFFAPYAYSDPVIRANTINGFLARVDFIRTLPNDKQPYPPEFIKWLKEHSDDIYKLIYERIPAFLSDFSVNPAVQEADLIGFGCFYNQTCASLAMSNACKPGRRDNASIVLGGASITKENAPVLLKHFTYVDYIIEGEGEIPFELLCECIEYGNDRSSLQKVPSLLFSDNYSGQLSSEPVVQSRSREEFADMDALPVLNYSVYFDALARSSFNNVIRSAPYETTRGCYWEQRSKCSFCGLAHNFPFRMKSAERVYHEITKLLDKNDIDYFICTDACLPIKQMRRLIPEMVDLFQHRDNDAMFFFEVRANLKKSDIALFSQLGTVVLQAGIESFSTDSLTLMRKGIDSLTNIQFLKWCKMENVYAFYNLLYGHPGESLHMYDETVNVIPSILHLAAPQSCMMVMLLRNSPLYNEAEEIGLKNIHPWNEYSILFPDFNDQEIHQVAYYFHYEYDLENKGSVEKQKSLLSMVRQWQHLDMKKAPHLYYEIVDNGNLLIYDNRSSSLTNESPITITINNPLLSSVFLSLDGIKTVEEIERHLHSSSLTAYSRPEIMDCLRRLIDKKLVIEESGRYLGLALPL